MQWLVDIEGAVADGLLTREAAAELKGRARSLTAEYAVNLLFFAGIVMVVAGVAYRLRDDSGALAALGTTVAVLSFACVLWAGRRLRWAANAGAMIGIGLATYAVTDVFFRGHDRFIAGAVLGLPMIAIGWVLYHWWPHRLSIIGAWILLLGAVVHISGILSAESQFDLQWLALIYIGALMIACGTVLDLRLVTAAAIVPLAAALSSRAWYEHASYTVAIYEVTLTIFEMALICALSLIVARALRERLARHARIMGQLALIWMNVAFWIGSLWGDVVGLYLWGPRWTSATTYTAWHEAIDAFKLRTLVVSPDLYAALWAIVIVLVGAWSAQTGRRAILNICVTFGAIHFYTQYFERLRTTPLAIAVAGLIAIVSALAFRRFSADLAKRTGPEREGKEAIPSNPSKG